jgi:hypothetical protein
MKMDSAFTGQNITAKSLDSQVNPEGQEMYTSKEEAIIANDRWLEIMNNTPEKDGLSPKDKYLKSKNEECLMITEMDKVELFWEWNKDPITYRKEGLQMIHNKRSLVYEVMDGQDVDVLFLSKYIGVEFMVKYNPKDFSQVALFVDNRFMCYATEKRRMAMAVQDYQPDEAVQIKSRLKVKKTQKEIANNKRKAAADVSSAEDIIKMGAGRVSKEILNKAEADMYADIIGTKPIEKEEPYLDLEQARRERARREDQYS